MDNRYHNVGSKTVSFKDLYPIMEEVMASGEYFCLNVTGNSMFPFLKHMRDQVLFASLGDRIIRRGDIVFYQRDNGQFVMHRVYNVDEKGEMTIVGDAQWVLESGIRPDQLRAFVPEVIRKGKRISCDKGAWHRFMIIWMKIRIRFPRLTKLFVRSASMIWRLLRSLSRSNI